MSINNASHMVGSSRVSGGSTPQHGTEPVIPHAYISYAEGSILDLGIIEPDIDFVQVWSIAHDLNDQGLVVGDQNQLRAFAWMMGEDGESSFVTLPMPANRARAYAVNNSAIIAGSAQRASSLNSSPAIWRFDPKENNWFIEHLPLFPSAIDNGEALDINDAGQSVGWVSRVSGFGLEETSWINLPAPAFGLPAGTHDLTPGLPHDRIVAINDQGVAVGGTRFVSPTPLIWDPRANAEGEPLIFTVWPTEITTNQTLDYLGASRLLGATFTDINNNEIIVGTAQYEIIEDNREGSITRAMIFLNNRYQLLDLLVADSGWQAFLSADAINDRNEIVGTGIDANGNRMGYVIPLNDLCLADMHAPFGTLDFFDVSEFLRRFTNQDPRADIAHPFGVFNIFDVSDYISGYLFNCNQE